MKSMYIRENHFKETYLRCENCNKVQTIHRNRGRMKQEGHIKTMYCFTCKKDTDFVEEPWRKYRSIEGDTFGMG